MNLPDIHGEEPEISVPINKVGLLNIKMPINFIRSRHKQITVTPTFDVFVDLPAYQKGIHPSRNYEVITEVLANFVDGTFKLEDTCANITRELLARHEYASRAEVKAFGEAVFERKTPHTGTLTFESCEIMASAILERNSDGAASSTKRVGVGITGMTACPCTQEIVRAYIRERLRGEHGLATAQVEDILEGIPVATHVQRSYGSIMMEVPADLDVDVMRLIDVIESGMSSATFELLKRSDEATLVLNALGQPRFVEDSIRHMMKSFIEEFVEMPDSIGVTFYQRNEESIHRHDIVAERVTTLGRIREELGQRTSRA